MKKRKKVKIDLTNLTPEQLGERAILHGDKMEGNANFPTPDPKPSDLKVSGESLLAKNREINALEKLLDEKKGELSRAYGDTYKLVVNAHKYVDLVADGDEQIMLNAAMSPTAEPQAMKDLPKIENVKLFENGESGCLLVAFDAVKGAKSYVIETNLAYDDPNGWTVVLVASSSRKVYLKGLKSGARNWVRVKAVGTRNIESSYSEPVSKVVQ